MVGVAGLREWRRGGARRGVALCVGPVAWCGVLRQGYGHICPPDFVGTKKMAVVPVGRWGEE